MTSIRNIGSMSALRLAAEPQPTPMEPSAPAPGSGDTPQAPAPIRDAQGRVYYPKIDQKTGELVYSHHSEGDLPNSGGHATLDIDIQIHADNSFDRTVHQNIKKPTTREVQDDVTKTKFDPAGVIVGETGDLHTELPGKTTNEVSTTNDEHTVSNYTSGAETHRTADLTKKQTLGEPAKDYVEATQKIHAEWDKNGQPLDDAVKPSIELDETTKYFNPGQGLYHDTPRVLTTNRTATGTPEGLRWNDPMKVSVRFEGHKGQYLERELEFPMDATGEPIQSQAKVVRDIDMQSGFQKALNKTRYWGGFVSSLMGIVGINMMAFPSTRTIGKAMVVGGVGLGVANVAAGVHALATRRTDGDVASTIMSGYDTLWLGLLAYATRNKGARSASVALAEKLPAMAGAAALGTGGIAGHQLFKVQTSKDLLDAGDNLPDTVGQEFGTTNKLSSATLALLNR